MARFLLDKGYVVHGIKRRSSSFNTGRIDDIYVDPHEGKTRFFFHYGDMTDSTNLIRLLQDIRPDEIYNLAAQSHVQVSFETPEYTANADGLGTLRLLEAMRLLQLMHTKFYQASTSELFGKAMETPQRETTPFYPRSPYGVAKLYAYWITVNYREAYGIFASNGILFNHEGPLRGETFVTRKITRAVAAIELGLQDRALYRKSRRTPRLGRRERFRQRHVAHAAAFSARRLMCSPPGKAIRCGNSSSWPLLKSDAKSPGGAAGMMRWASIHLPVKPWSKSTDATCGQLRLMHYKATHPRQNRS